MTGICVCGAGTMGTGIAQVIAMAGLPVILFDLKREALMEADGLLGRNGDYLVTKGKISPARKQEMLANITLTSTMTDCKADMILEAIVEDLEAKAALFQELSGWNGPEVIFATNTSSLSVSELQSRVPHPERVLGMHFFNPPYIMKLVEVVAGHQTQKETIATVVELCHRLGKEPVVCRDFPGFIVNRVARHYYLEALKLAEEGVAGVQDIDGLLEASGFKMGPFRLMDLIGMDINLKVSQSLYDALGRPERLRPSPLQEQMVEQGKLGKKTGEGFYEYQSHE